MLAPGTVIDGRFEIVEFLGEGGMGTVYAARHQAMDRTIALKLLKANLIRDEDKIARFRREARVLSSLQHPNIIAIHAIGIADTGQPYMAMDIVSGESISDTLQRCGPFSQDGAIRICIQICAGLHYAHTNQIIHRDVKPSNIILSTTDGGAPTPKLVDFGIAKVLDPQTPGQDLTQTGMAIGSVFYLSPGQFEGRAACPASDIYALGCTLYEMLAGTPPFQADNYFQAALMHSENNLVPINQQNPHANADPAVEQIVAAMLAKEHHLRYQSAQDVQEDLTNALNHRPLKFAPSLGTIPAKPPVQPSTIRKILITIPATAIIAIAITAAVRFRPVPQSERIDLQSETRTMLEIASAHNDTSTKDIAASQKLYDTVLVPATRKAELTHDPILIAQALRQRAVLLANIYRAERRPPVSRTQTLTWLSHSYDVANNAILSGHYSPDEMRQLKFERFQSISAHFTEQLRDNCYPPISECNRYIAAFKAAEASIKKDEKGSETDIVANTEITAINDGKRDEFFALAKMHVALMDSVGTTPDERKEKIEKYLPKIKEKFGAADAQIAKKMYGD